MSDTWLGVPHLCAFGACLPNWEWACFLVLFSDEKCVEIRYTVSLVLFQADNITWHISY